MIPVLLVDDDADLLDAMTQLFELEGYAVTPCSDPDTAMKALAHGPARGQGGRSFPGVIVSDIRMPGMSGLALMGAVRALDPDIPVILVTGHGDVPLAVQAMREGAWDFVEKPFENAQLVGAVRRASEKRRLVLDNRALREVDPSGVPIPLRGLSPVAEAMADRYRRLLEARGGALVVAPQGAGANRLVRDLAAPFETSRRLNCSNLGELAELELFGTGGVFEAARGGALVLDNVTTLSPRLQGMVAERDESHDPVLILSTMNPTGLDPSLLDAFAGRRLDVVPLAQRREDVPTLFVALAQRASARFLRPVPDLPAGFDAWLVEQTFEGNVGELQALAEQFVLGLREIGSIPPPLGHGRLSERIAAHERLLIEAELARHDGRIRPTYEALGLSRKGLYDKMRRYGIAARTDG